MEGGVQTAPPSRSGGKHAPIAGAYELHRALRDQGVPTKFIIHRGAGHLPSSHEQLEAVAEHNLEWFGQWSSSQ